MWSAAAVSGMPLNEGRPPRDSSSRSNPARMCLARWTVSVGNPAKRATWIP